MTIEQIKEITESHLANLILEINNPDYKAIIVAMAPVEVDGQTGLAVTAMGCVENPQVAMVMLGAVIKKIHNDKAQSN